jgi:hypothetical protein
VKAVAGIATFDNLKISQPGTGLSLQAASGLLTAVTSAAFDVATTATKLFFSTQPPASVVAGITLPAIRVQVQDGLGANLPLAGVPVTVTLGPSGALNGTVTRSTDVQGIATFNDLIVDTRSRTNATLTATATGFIAVTSDTFAVTADMPSRMTFRPQPPPSVTVGEPVSPVIAVALRNAGGYLARQPGITITLTMSGGGTLTNSSATTNLDGLAIFTGLTATAPAGTGYTLSASSTGLASVTSDAFTVIAGGPAQLGFLTQPSSSTNAGESISPAVQVEVRDAGGNRVTDSSVTVTLSLGGNPTGATLSGNVVTAVGGVAQFPDLQVSLAGSGYTLMATTPGLPSATSTTFRIR